MNINLDPSQRGTPDVKAAFYHLLNEAQINPGTVQEIVTFTRDPINGSRRVFSGAFTAPTDERLLDEGLTQLIKFLVPDGESRQTLEEGFKEGPNIVKNHTHYDEVVSEWPTVYSDVVIGIRSTSDQMGEFARTWYLRNTQKKPARFRLFKHSN